MQQSLPELDDVLHNNSNSISQLNDMLTEERCKLDELIKDLSELAGKINSILPEEAPTHPDIL